MFVNKRTILDDTDLGQQRIAAGRIGKTYEQVARDASAWQFSRPPA
jgi:hypothetical protein